MSNRRSGESAGPRRQLRVGPNVFAAHGEEEFVFRIEIVIHPEVELIAIHFDCARERRL
jgi:hypothetical protein